MIMDLERIELLLEKYYNAETTIDEEKTLTAFFNSGNVPDCLKHDQKMFLHFIDMKSGGTNLEIEKVLLTKHKLNNQTLFFQIPKLKWAYGMAAGILLAFGFWGVFKLTPITKNNTGVTTDQKLAYTQTKQALLKISNNLNKGNQQISKISKIYEVEYSLTNKNK